MSPNYRRLLIVLGPCVVGVLLALVYYRRGQTLNFTIGPYKVVGPSTIRQLPFALNGKQIAQRGITIPHVSTIKRENVEFRGRIITQSGTFGIHVHGFEPIAVLEFDRSAYLLAREPFRKHSHCFFQLSTATSSGVAIPIDAVPLELLAIELESQEDWTRYRSWAFNELARASAHGQALSLFEKLLNDDVRFLFTPKWPAEQPRDDLMNFLIVYVAGQSRVEYYSLLARSLHASGPTDGSALLNDLCFALLKLDPERAKRDVCEFLVRVRQEGVPGDTRRTIRLDIDGRRLIDCDSVEAKK